MENAKEKILKEKESIENNADACKKITDAMEMENFSYRYVCIMRNLERLMQELNRIYSDEYFGAAHFAAMEIPKFQKAWQDLYDDVYLGHGLLKETEREMIDIVTKTVSIDNHTAWQIRGIRKAIELHEKMIASMVNMRECLCEWIDMDDVDGF